MVEETEVRTSGARLVDDTLSFDAGPSKRRRIGEHSGHKEIYLAQLRGFEHEPVQAEALQRRVRCALRTEGLRVVNVDAFVDEWSKKCRSGQVLQYKYASRPPSRLEAVSRPSQQAFEREFERFGRADALAWNVTLDRYLLLSKLQNTPARPRS